MRWAYCPPKSMTATVSCCMRLWGSLARVDDGDSDIEEG
jgi:hypothetical protein